MTDDSCRRATLMLRIAQGSGNTPKSLARSRRSTADDRSARLTTESVQHAAGLFEYYAGSADKLHGSTVRMGSDTTALVEREPFGPWALFRPRSLAKYSCRWRPATRCGCVGRALNRVSSLSSAKNGR
ncbi:aldehyde dehydrogenase family protein [Bradyrhizobium vignae]|uniref:Aldehyde dehydrogenase family protein n=1 Tax=Bradyrhizobium vignae TaxID=1549949 RepID=A0ABS4A3F4_9BRAD|nr:aldehyde dehydrogenase family protein [Bradyrhizobium vignae]